MKWDMRGQLTRHGDVTVVRVPACAAIFFFRTSTLEAVVWDTGTIDLSASMVSEGAEWVLTLSGLPASEVLISLLRNK
jgi:hypothetical protein